MFKFPRRKHGRGEGRAVKFHALREHARLVVQKQLDG